MSYIFDILCIIIFVDYECKSCIQFIQKIHVKYIFILGIEYTQFILKSINIWYYYVVLNNNGIYIFRYFV